MEIVIMTKNKNSFDRIKSNFEDNYKIRYVETLSELKQLLFISEVGILLIDPLHQNFEDIEVFCAVKNIDLIIFNGNFNKAVDEINSYIVMRQYIEEEVSEKLEPKDAAHEVVFEEEDITEDHAKSETNNEDIIILDVFKKEEIKEEAEPVVEVTKSKDINKRSFDFKLKLPTFKIKRNKTVYPVDVETVQPPQDKQPEKYKIITLTPKIIVVGGLWRGVGCTQLSLMLSSVFNKNKIGVNYFELNTNPVIKELFEEQPSVSLNETQPIPLKKNYVNYFYLDKGDINDIEVYQEVIKHRNHPINIIDIGNDWDSAKDIVLQADKVLCLIEPDISKLNKLEVDSSGNKESEIYKLMSKLKNEIPVQFVLMKYSNQLEQEFYKEIESIPLLEDMLKISYIPYNKIIKAHYEQNILYEQRAVRKKIIKHASTIFQDVLPKEIKIK